MYPAGYVREASFKTEVRRKEKKTWNSFAGSV